MTIRPIICAAVVALGLAVAGYAQAAGQKPPELVAGLHRQAPEAFQTAWRQYVNSRKPYAFALAIDGSSASSYFCAEFACEPGDAEFYAIRTCKRGATAGISCKIYARGRRVVWDGPFPWPVERDVLADYWIWRSSTAQ